MKYLAILFFCLLSNFIFSQQLDEIFIYPVNIYVYDEKEIPLSGVEVSVSDGKEMLGTKKTDEKTFTKSHRFALSGKRLRYGADCFRKSRKICSG